MWAAALSGGPHLHDMARRFGGRTKVDFENIAGGFRLSLRGRPLIEHTYETPWIAAGRGSGVYDMHEGNFSISDRLGMKLPLPDWECESTPEGMGTPESVRVVFSDKGRYPVAAVFSGTQGECTVRFERPQWGADRLWLRLCADEDEHVYGCGEQFSCFDLRGRHFPLWSSEQGVGRNKSTRVTFEADRAGHAGGDYYTTFFPAPTFVTSRMTFCHVSGTAYMDFDFRPADHHILEIWQVPGELVFGADDSFTALSARLTGLLGRQPQLPEWVSGGVILGIQDGTENCLKKLERAQKAGVKVAGIWAQDWEGRRMTSFGKRLMWNWQWDRGLYPGLDEKIKELRGRGVRFLGYINPYLAADGALFKEASDNGCLGKRADGGDYLVDFGEFTAGVVDLTYPKAFEWYKQVIKKYMIDFGLSGWMADFGEYLPTDIILHSAADARLMHNAWPVLWARVNSEAISESGRAGDVTFFMRAGYTGSQKYSALMWAGDQNVDWSEDDGLPSVIPAALSLGMTGCGLHHSDIGGYTTLYGMKRSRELFMRWAELAAFTVMMRTHEGNRPEDNWQFDSDDATLEHLARMSGVFAALAPYVKNAQQENTQAGLPVMRPLFMHYPDCAGAYSVKDEYLLGRDILAAPVLTQGAVGRSVLLPQDSWIHLWSGAEYSGGRFEISAPLGEPPVFYRAGCAYSGLFASIRRRFS
jgi:alpha-glucosidase